MYLYVHEMNKGSEIIYIESLMRKRNDSSHTHFGDYLLYNKLNNARDTWIVFPFFFSLFFRFSTDFINTMLILFFYGFWITISECATAFQLMILFFVWPQHCRFHTKKKVRRRKFRHYRYDQDHTHTHMDKVAMADYRKKNLVRSHHGFRWL